MPVVLCNPLEQSSYSRQRLCLPSGHLDGATADPLFPLFSSLILIAWARLIMQGSEWMVELAEMTDLARCTSHKWTYKQTGKGK